MRRLDLYAVSGKAGSVAESTSLFLKRSAGVDGRRSRPLPIAPGSIPATRGVGTAPGPAIRGGDEAAEGRGKRLAPLERPAKAKVVEIGEPGAKE